MKGQLKALLLVAAVFSGILSGTQAQAAESIDRLARYTDYGFSSKTEMKNYFSVKNIEVKEQSALITPEVLEHLNRLSAQANTGSAAPMTPGDLFENLTGLDIESWITLGQKVWQVIVANKPVANVSTQRVSVLPMAQQDWVQMENWQGPAVKTFTIAAKNLYGMTVISHTYTVAFNYGGSFQGKGQFLANATVIPTRVDVSWGFTLNSEVEVGHVLNTGSKDSPVPGVDLQVKWKMDSILKHLEGRESFFVKGDGSVLQIAGGM